MGNRSNINNLITTYTDRPMCVLIFFVVCSENVRNANESSIFVWTKPYISIRTHITLHGTTVYINYWTRMLGDAVDNNVDDVRWRRQLRQSIHKRRIAVWTSAFWPHTIDNDADADSDGHCERLSATTLFWRAWRAAARRCDHIYYVVVFMCLCLRLKYACRMQTETRWIYQSVLASLDKHNAHTNTELEYTNNIRKDTAHVHTKIHTHLNRTVSLWRSKFWIRISRGS